MTQAEAKIGSGYQIVRLKPGPVFDVTLAGKPHDIWTIEAMNGKVVYVSHGIDFADGSQPNAQSTWLA